MTLGDHVGDKPQIIVAKFKGTCTKCHGRFPAGSPIIWERITGRFHMDCGRVVWPDLIRDVTDKDRKDLM